MWVGVNLKPGQKALIHAVKTCFRVTGLFMKVWLRVRTSSEDFSILWTYLIFLQRLHQQRVSKYRPAVLCHLSLLLGSKFTHKKHVFFKCQYAAFACIPSKPPQSYQRWSTISRLAEWLTAGAARVNRSSKKKVKRCDLSDSRVHVVLKRQDDGERWGLEGTLSDRFYHFLQKQTWRWLNANLEIWVKSSIIRSLKTFISIGFIF